MAKKSKKAKKPAKKAAKAAGKKSVKKRPAPKKKAIKKSKPAVKKSVKPKAKSKPKPKVKLKAQPKAKKAKPAPKKAKAVKKVLKKGKPKAAAKKAVKPVIKKRKPLPPKKKNTTKAVKAVKAAKPVKKVLKKAAPLPKKADKKVSPKKIITPPKAEKKKPEIVVPVIVEKPVPSKPARVREPKAPRIIKAPIITGAMQQEILIKNEKEPKGKFELEYVIHCSPPILFEFLTTPSGLSEWFCDDVNIRDGIYSFFWNGGEQKAKLIGYKEQHYVRFQWLDKAVGYYFEFRIQTDELTGDVALIVSDFADSDSEKQTSSLLWDSQVHKLMKVIGSY